MVETSALQKEYIQLLERHGLQIPSRQLTEADKQLLLNEYQQTSVVEGLGVDASEGFTRVMQEWIGNEYRGMNPLLDLLSKEIEEAANAAGLRLQVDVFAGEFPTGSFNAQACCVPSGVLVLVNTGLMMFLHHAIKVLLLSIPTKYREFTKEQATEALADLLLAYLFFREPRRAQRLSAHGGVKGILSGMICGDCETFVLAHEYGHAILGHLSSPHMALANSPVGDIELVAKDWQQETEADTMAAMLMIAQMARVIQSNTPDEWKRLKMDSMIAGALLFFAFDQLITQSVKEILDLQNVPILTNHPPSEQRSKALRSFFESISEEAPKAADGYVEWLVTLQEDVVSSLKRLLLRSKT